MIISRDHNHIVTTRESWGSICKALLTRVVGNKHGSNIGKQVYRGQDRRVALGQAWVDDQQTISNKGKAER